MPQFSPTYTLFIFPFVFYILFSLISFMYWNVFFFDLEVSDLDTELEYFSWAW